MTEMTLKLDGNEPLLVALCMVILYCSLHVPDVDPTSKTEERSCRSFPLSETVESLTVLKVEDEAPVRAARCLANSLLNW